MVSWLFYEDLYSTPSRRNSPLPPSSPPPSSPLLWSLVLPEDIITEDMTVDDHSSESLLGISLLCQLPIFSRYIWNWQRLLIYLLHAFPFVDRLGKLEELELASNSDRCTSTTSPAPILSFIW